MRNDIPERYQEASLKTCNQTDIVLKLKSFRETERGNALIISGCNGCGKTYAMWAMIRSFEKQSEGKMAFLTEYNLKGEPYEKDYWRVNPNRRRARVIGPGWFTRLGLMPFEKRDSEIRQAERADFLFIDDMGAEETGPLTFQVLEALIDYRYRHKKTTVMLTDMRKETFTDRYSKRIISRLREWGCMDGSFFESINPSYRLTRRTA